MKTNFDFLPTSWDTLKELAIKAENNVYLDPRATLTELRLFAEGLTQGIFYFNNLSTLAHDMNQYERLNYLQNKAIIGDDVVNYLQLIRKKGNEVAHSNVRHFSSEEAMEMLHKGYVLANWFMLTYIDHDYQVKSFENPIDDHQKEQALMFSMR